MSDDGKGTTSRYGEITWEREVVPFPKTRIISTFCLRK